MNVKKVKLAGNLVYHFGMERMILNGNVYWRTQFIFEGDIHEIQPSKDPYIEFLNQRSPFELSSLYQ